RDVELTQINEKITTMAKHVQGDIVRAVEAIKEKNVELAREIIDNGDIVDDLEDEINGECFRFLATQAPVAGDLRYCISVMKMVRDLERMGDHCEDLAKYALRLKDETYPQELVDLPRMAEMAAHMVNNAIEAFLNRDLRLARKVWKADEEVDELFRVIYEDQLKRAETEKAGICISFAFIAAHLERIADYATNVCEEAVFSMEGIYSMD
ncbi:MAG: phosphate signaling complex protein PhoU, partial [Anaerovoracaceae bacterium]